MPVASVPAVRRFLLDLIPVALGVYLAILAGNCNEHRKTRALTARMTEALAREARDNYRAVAANLHYHERFRDTLFATVDAAAGGAAAPTLGRLFGIYRGVRMGGLRNGAYEAALASQAVEALDTDVLLSVTSAYALQARYDRIGDNYLSWASRINSGTAYDDGVTFMRAPAFAAIYTEGDLRDAFAEAIRQLGAPVPEIAADELRDPYAPGDDW